MAQAEVTSRRSAAVAAVRRLHTKAGRRQSLTFLVEGPQALREALTHRADIQQVYVTADAVTRWDEVMQAARDASTPITLVSENAMAAMAETKSPQGLVAVCGMRATSLEEVMANQPQVLVALDQVSDPGNVGTIIRTADAAGAQGVLLTGESVDPFNGKCVRASAGSIFHLPVIPEVQVQDLVVAARQQGAVIAVTTAVGERELFEWLDSTSLGPEPVTNPTLWVFGSEAHGVSATLLEVADVRVRIPIHGAAESLNIASAVAVCLYADADRRRARLS